MLFFDCELGYGKGRFLRTVVALRGDRADFGPARFGPDLDTEQVDGWTLVYGSRRLLEVGELQTSFSKQSGMKPASNREMSRKCRPVSDNAICGQCNEWADTRRMAQTTTGTGER
jgi:hypothetical protein